MTQILTANIGSYPRIGEEKDQQRHRRGLSHLQSGELSKHAFRDVEHSVIQEVVREQIDAGVDEVTDGLVSWSDPISHMTRALSGIQKTALARYFDNNFYFRVPQIQKKPKKTRSILIPDYEFTKSISSKPVRAVLTGPYTLAYHSWSQSKVYSKLSSRVELFTELIQSEIAALIQKDARLIQINEPSIARNPENMKIFVKAITKLTANQPHARFILSVSFSPLAAIYDQLIQLPVNVLNLDCTLDGKKLIEKIMKKKAPVILGLGLINARNTRMEAIDPIIRTVREFIEKQNPESIYLTPSSGLEFLPRSYSFAKLQLLTRVKNELCQIQAGPSHG